MWFGVTYPRDPNMDSDTGSDYTGGEGDQSVYEMSEN